MLPPVSNLVEHHSFCQSLFFEVARCGPRENYTSIHCPFAGITRIRFKGSMADRKPSSQPGPFPAPLSKILNDSGRYLRCAASNLNCCHAVSLKKYLGHCGQLGSCGLGLKSNSSSIPILRDSSRDVRMMLGNLTSSGISTIPTAYGAM